MKKGIFGMPGYTPDPVGDGRIDTKNEVYDFLKDLPEDSRLVRILSSMPVYIEVENIKALTDKQCEVLRAGDIVNKVDQTGKHAYLVTFKNQAGMCLTYGDCENVETVAYDKVEGSWTYQSTDVTPIGTKADRSLMVYDDVYLGVAEESSTVIDDAYHHDEIVRGRPVAFTSAEGYIWLVLPAKYSPVVAMSLVETPMSLDSTTEIGGKTYKVWKSAESQTGTFGAARTCHAPVRSPASVSRSAKPETSHARHDPADRTAAGARDSGERAKAEGTAGQERESP